jgi:two-component system sensor histidine kinase KdpD
MNEPSSHRSSKHLLFALGTLSVVLTGLASASAFTTLGARFPSSMVDSYGFYSIVELPTWAPLDQPPKGLHRLAAVDDEPLPTGPPPRPLRGLYALLENKPGDSVDLVFDTEKGPVHSRARIARLGTRELLFLFVTYALAAWAVLWSGALVALACHRVAARRAYTLWALSTFLFLISFYDHHTRAWLFPAFSLSTVGVLLSALWLAYSFPRAPRRGAPVLRGLLIAVSLVAGVAAAALLMAPWLGWNSLPIRRAIDWLTVPVLLTLALVLLARLRFSAGIDRRDLVIASWGLISTPLLVGAFHLVRMLTTRDVMHLVMPFVVLTFPLSTGYALIRHNLLESRLVLTTWMVRVPLALVALVVTVLSTALLAALLAGPVLALPLGFVLFLLLLLLVQRLQMRLFFPAALAFRGTVGRLKDQLASLREAAAIQRAVEEAVAQALPTRPARVLAPEHPHALASLPTEARERLAKGENVWSGNGPQASTLVVPMRSLGELRALLCVSSPGATALFTQEDLGLLETLASLGALALHNAAAVQELESLRRLEVGAARDEKRLTLSALGAEIRHEMVYPMNFLRGLLRRSAGGLPLDGEDLSMARLEIERMDRLVQSLREHELPPPPLGPLPLLAAVERALIVLREQLEHKHLSVSVDIPAGLHVHAEMDSAIQLFSNLLRNAAQSTPEHGALGVRYRDEASAPSIEVWDTGPGIPEELAGILFTRRVSTRADGFGIGLTVVERIARSFRWTVSFSREGGLTCFRLTLPPRTEHEPTPS